MVYTQVVTLATYVFFIFTVIGRQKIDNKHLSGGYMRSGRMPLDIDLYLPIFISVGLRGVPMETISRN